jgi:hypothetical protein
LSKHLAILMLLAMPIFAGCRKPAAAPKAVEPAAAPVQFTDVTAASGIRFIHNNGAVGGKWLPETMGSGCASSIMMETAIRTSSW